jgi:DNA-binding LacI/PurR family transcriptional regulator
MLSSDGPVRYAAAACRALGLEPNRDIVLTGYDNYWAGSEEARFEPATPMATVDKRNLKMGEELVRLWWERNQGQLPPEPQTRRIQPELVVVD